MIFAQQKPRAEIGIQIVCLTMMQQTSTNKLFHVVQLCLLALAGDMRISAGRSNSPQLWMKAFGKKWNPLIFVPDTCRLLAADSFASIIQAGHCIS